MFGLVLCFLVPGVLIGFLLSDGLQRARIRARRERLMRARREQKKLYIYDLQADWEEMEQAA